MLGMDARVQYTQMVIEKAFVALMKTKPLGKITVTEICQAAGVNRATFYKYYEDPADLRRKLEENTVASLDMDLGELTGEALRRTYLGILSRVEENAEVYKPLFFDEDIHYFASSVYAMCYGHVEPKLRERFPSLSDARLQWLYYFVVQGGCSLMHRWVSDGMTESAESVADFFVGLVKGAVSDLG